jgi:hypothetical protein
VHVISPDLGSVAFGAPSSGLTICWISATLTSVHGSGSTGAALGTGVERNNVSALKLHRRLGVSYPTAWLMKRKLLEIMRQREDSRWLAGRVRCPALLSNRVTSSGKIAIAIECASPGLALRQQTGVARGSGRCGRCCGVTTVDQCCRR